ncbi:hypothetical protein BT96DRAFT_919156 [Gymnopus androsaceus JB14]|uniref:Uncharacterized protein n=1 Tax=Gymnopus androsaceus JB14 TaxID=1447944 RepID=A0A6A4HW88_9AGAR|nr:hypothetical protein BT96DRAFT_919156 [Gymnopus androsaceus JB14]
MNAAPAELANSIALWGVQKAYPGPEEVPPDAQPLELVRFSDFGLSGDAIPVECRDREYLGVVKRCKDVERQLEVTFALTSPSAAPFKPEGYRAHIPLVIFSIMPRSEEYSPHEQSLSLSGTFCLEEPREEVIAKGSNLKLMWSRSLTKSRPHQSVKLQVSSSQTTSKMVKIS